MSEANNYPEPMTELLDVLVAESRVVLEMNSKEQLEDVGKSIIHDVVGLKDQVSRGRVYTRDEIFLKKVFDAYNEVFKSYDVLLLFLKICKSDLKIEGVTESMMVSFWQEAYFNEYYILWLRMDAFLTFLEKAYKKDLIATQLKVVLSELRPRIKEALKQGMEQRGRHVHEKRFSEQEETIKRISLTELLVVHGGMKELDWCYQDAVREGKSCLVDRVSGANLDAMAQLSDLFAAILPIVRSGGKLRYPSAM